MSVLSRTLGLLARVLRGENILIAQQSSSKWDTQYKKGSWNYLLDDIPPNALFLADLIAKRRGRQKILDVGCGNGGLLFALEKKGIEVDYVGVDFSVEAIRKAKEHFPGRIFFVGDATRPQGSWGKDFDVIVFNEVLYYVPAMETLRKYRDLLAPGGTTLVSMYRSWRTLLIAWMLHLSGQVGKSFVIKNQRGYPAFILLRLSL